MSLTGKAAGWLAGRLKGEKARKKTINWMNKTGVGQLLGAAGDAALIGGAARGAAKGLGALKGMFTAGSGAAAAAAGPSIAERIGAGEMLDEGGAGILGTSAASVPEAAAGAAGGGLKPLPQMPGRPSVGRLYPGAPTLRGNQAESYLNALRAPGAPSPTGAAGRASGFLGGLARGAGSLVGGTSGGGSTLRSLLTNPQVLAGAAGGVADVMGQRSQQRIAEQQMEQQGEQFQQRFNVEEEERKRQQAQANRLAGFFMPRAQG